MYVVHTVFCVINKAMALTQCIGYNCAIKYSSSSSDVGTQKVKNLIFLGKSLAD